MPMSDGARDLWNEMQRDAMPDFEVLRETTHVARKVCYRCEACRAMIQKGQQYHYTVLLEDGEFQTHVRHVRCAWW